MTDRRIEQAIAWDQTWVMDSLKATPRSWLGKSGKASPKPGSRQERVSDGLA